MPKKSLTGLLNLHYPSEYSTWGGMKARCYYLKHKDYKNYGGRGITVCERWRSSFVNFLLDMGPRPSSIHTLDRRNNVKGYDKSNCRWATPAQQGKNTRINRWLTYKKRTRILADWARELNRTPTEIQYYLKRGKDFEWIYKHFKSIINRPKINKYHLKSLKVKT